MRAPYAAALGALALLVQGAGAQKVSYSDTTGLTFFQGTKTQRVGGDPVPTGVYTTYHSKITLTGAASPKTHSGSGSGTSTGSAASGTLTTGSLGIGSNLTATATGSVPQPTNTQACNNYVELCSRKFGNITQVGCHNSPFVRPGNSGSNQELPVKTQLDDGVRFLQAQIQWPANGTVPHFCHTTCDLLDAGPITEWLGEVYEWVDAHPYDVVTILLGNGNYSDPAMYVPYIEQTGILKYTFVPTVFPMALDDWPTLENMILHGNRVVMFLDYKANQTAFPWLMDEFSQMWETQFDPVDRAFPCAVQASGAWSVLRRDVVRAGGDGPARRWAVGLLVFFAAMEWSPLTQSFSSLAVRFPMLLLAWCLLCTPHTLRLILGLGTVAWMAVAAADGNI
ncbi:PLC-like phosphodiesterase [Trichoderma novae-zelandiae]